MNGWNLPYSPRASKCGSWDWNPSLLSFLVSFPPPLIIVLLKLRWVYPQEYMLICSGTLNPDTNRIHLPWASFFSNDKQFKVLSLHWEIKCNSHLNILSNMRPEIKFPTMAMFHLTPMLQPCPSPTNKATIHNQGCHWLPNYSPCHYLQ